jgi:hypothetical protein
MTPGCHTLVALLIVVIATILLIDGFLSAPRNGSNRSSPAGVALLLGDRRTVFSATKARGAHSKSNSTIRESDASQLGQFRQKPVLKGVANQKLMESAWRRRCP